MTPDEVAAWGELPWKLAPAGMVLDAHGNRVLDMRGWGHLTGGGAMNLPEKAAAAIQDAMGARLVRTMNSMPMLKQQLREARAVLEAAKAELETHQLDHDTNDRAAIEQRWHRETKVAQAITNIALTLANMP